METLPSRYSCRRLSEGLQVGLPEAEATDAVMVVTAGVLLDAVLVDVQDNVQLGDWLVVQEVDADAVAERLAVHPLDEVADADPV